MGSKSVPAAPEVKAASVGVTQSGSAESGEFCSHCGVCRHECSAGTCPDLIVDLLNITSWPVRSANGLVDHKTTYLMRSTAHVMVLPESHLFGSRESGMGKQFAQSAKWTVASAAAQPSYSTDHSSHGGVILAMRSYLQLQPPSTGRHEKHFWRISQSAFCTWFYIYVKSIPILIFGGYARSGINSVEGQQMMQELLACTNQGKRPFMAFCDFNATPEEVQQSGWLSLLDATIKSAGVPTCTSRNIDFAVVSRQLEHLINYIGVDWCHPFHTHARVRFCVSRNKQEYLRYVPCKPKPLPTLLESQAGSGTAAKLWAHLEGEANLPSRCDALLQRQPAKCSEGEGLGAIRTKLQVWQDHAPEASEILKLASMASDDIECYSFQPTKEAAESQVVSEISQGEIGVHPFSRQLGGTCSATSKELQNLTEDWTTIFEVWHLKLAAIDPELWGGYLGRQGIITWKKVPVGDNRSSAIPGVQVAPDLSEAARVLATIKKIMTWLEKNRECVKARQALKKLLLQAPVALAPLIEGLGHQAVQRIVHDLQRCYMWCRGTGTFNCKVFLNKVALLDKKILAFRVDDRSRDTQKWLSKLFERNFSLAHRWVNAPNVQAVSPALASDGTTLSMSLLEDQVDIFSNLWSCEAPLEVSYYDVFSKLRNIALQGSHDSWIEQHKHHFTPWGLRSLLRKFKTRTSTGTCNLSLAGLRGLPDCALATLGRILLCMLSHILGPADTVTAWLHLLEKKKGGYRTIATFTSLWRLVMSAISDDFKDWDKMHSFEFDTSSVGNPPAVQMMKRSLQMRMALSKEGSVHAGILWDIATFFEEIKPHSMGEAAMEQGMHPASAAMSLWGFASPRHLRLGETVANKAFFPSKSIATGCHTATAFARAILKKPVWASMFAAPNVVLSLHVDDCGQECTDLQEIVYRSLADGGWAFASEAMKLSLRISPKSVIFSSSDAVSKRLQTFFENKGLHLKIEKAPEHLGHCRAHAPRLAFAIIRKRLKKAAVRKKRIAYLARLSPKATGLVKTGLVPQGTFGTEVLGMDLTLQARLDSLAAKSCFPFARRSCNTTILHLWLKSFPSVKALIGLLKTFTSFG